MSLILPVIKLQTSKYMLGTHLRELIIKRSNLLLRVGGGYTDLKNFLLKEAKLECLKILLLVESEQSSFCDVMCAMMATNGGSTAEISTFRESNIKMNEPFKKIVSAVRLRDYQLRQK